jgi:hypothetical protein
MLIYFRACEKQNTISYVTRFNNINKTIILKKCWLSIQNSISSEDKVILIEDSLSSDTLNWLYANSKTEIVKVSVPNHSWEFHQHTVTLVEALAQFSEQFPEELHYIVEDDYLHTPDALNVLRDTLFSWNYFAVPYDYPDRYNPPKPCNVLVGKDRHWRTIDSGTMTAIAKGKTWLTYMSALKEAAPTSNDKVFEEIYSKVPCINPLPGVASHMTDKHHTPLVNWNQIWENINV